MIDLTRFGAFSDFLEYTSLLDNEKWELLVRIDEERRRIVRDFKRTRKARLKDLEGQARENLFEQLIAHRDRALADWEAASVDHARLAYVNDQLDKIDGVKESINSLRTKTNEQWLNIITGLMSQRGGRKYSIKFFEREFEYVGIGTHSDMPQSYDTETETVVAIVADDFNIDGVDNYTFSWPDEHPEDYEGHDFVLYDRLRHVEAPEVFLPKQKTVTRLWGMPPEVEAAIDELLFKEYMQQR